MARPMNWPMMLRGNVHHRRRQNMSETLPIMMTTWRPNVAAPVRRLVMLHVDHAFCWCEQGGRQGSGVTA
jgi:hypothetical protein